MAPKKTHTHNGPCHGDETVGVAIVFETFPGSTVTRSRNPADRDAADIVIDDGGKYDGEKHFDHHPPLKLQYRANGVPYASAGLMLKKFGPVWVEQVAAENGFTAQAVVDRIDELFVQAVDAKDNGHLVLGATLKDTDVPLPPNDYNSMVRMFAPSGQPGELGEDELFLQAVEVTRVFLRRVLREAIASLKADKLVRDNDKGEEILILEVGCPWHGEVIRNLPHVRLVVLPQDKGGWMVCPVPLRVGQPEYRLPLPKPWHGKKDAELSELVGVDGMKLCTSTGHVIFTTTREGALATAKKLIG